jgi:hypothetical protein
MATRWDSIPNLNDNVVRSAREDLQKAQRGRNVDSSNLKGAAKDVVREAGERARNRNLGRFGAAGAALQGGYEVGRAIDEKTGLGKKMVEKSGIGDLIDRAINSRDKVELSKEAKDRIAAGELEEKEAPKPRKRDTESASPEGKMRPGRNEEIDDETRENAGGYKRGGKVKKMAKGGMTASKRADGIASRGKTKCKMY